MAINARKKGKQIELAWAKWLQDQGLSARRGRQYSGSPHSPDVICEQLDKWIHWEVKGRKSAAIIKHMEQAARDCGTKYPVVALKANRKPWLVCMWADDMFDLAAVLADEAP